MLLSLSLSGSEPPSSPPMPQQPQTAATRVISRSKEVNRNNLSHAKLCGKQQRFRVRITAARKRAETCTSRMG